jgi:hypothetical protein
MSVNLFPFLYLWLVMDAMIVVLFGYRQTVARKEDPGMHVLHAGAPAQQVAFAQKLGQIDKWGKLLTIVAVVFGVILGSAAIALSFVSPGSPAA